jgi:dihydrofolate synthase / folylpolyglutamate synthase
MTYREAIEYLSSFINYERNASYSYKSALKLERVKGFLVSLGDPQEEFRSIHVAGTKGKGSVCAFCAYILRSAGYKVGLYTSPHLCDIRERIRILKPLSGKRYPRPGAEFEGMISRREFASLVKRLKPRLDRYCRDCQYGPLSFFEVYTVLTLVYFKEKKIDFAVLETGLGGRLDATNVVHSAVCGISPISRDHTELLGNSLTAIAGEKAGIIKSRNDNNRDRKLTVVAAPQKREALRVIKNRCGQEKAVLYSVGKKIRCRNIKAGSGQQRFDLTGIEREYHDLRIRMAGEHQVLNAAMAVGLVESLARSCQANLRFRDIRNGLADTVWPGRFEIFPGDPLVVLDGAHNDASAGSLRQTLEKEFKGKDVIFLLGISRDKDIGGICRQLSRAGKKFILTRADNPRAASCAQILRKLRAYKPKAPVMISNNVREGLRLAMSAADKESLIVVTGSLFVVGEARGALLKNKGKYGQA